MKKKLAPLHLRQANLRRWLDKRVPVYARDNELTKKDTKKLIKMINKQQIEFILHDFYPGKIDGQDYSEIVVCEDQDLNDMHNWYVLYAGTTKKCNKFIKKHLS